MNGQTHDPVHGARYSFQPDGENLIVDTWLEPGGALPPHFHPHQEEHWSVVEGEVRFQLGNDKRLLRPEDGEVPVLPGTKHGVTSSGDREAHLRCRVVPARNLQSSSRTARQPPARASSCEAASPRTCEAPAGRPTS